MQYDLKHKRSGGTTSLLVELLVVFEIDIFGGDFKSPYLSDILAKLMGTSLVPVLTFVDDRARDSPSSTIIVIRFLCMQIGTQEPVAIHNRTGMQVLRA